MKAEFEKVSGRLPHSYFGTFQQIPLSPALCRSLTCSGYKWLRKRVDEVEINIYLS